MVRDGRQVESITFSWCTVATATDAVRRLTAGAAVDYGAADERVDLDPRHRCLHCA